MLRYLLRSPRARLAIVTACLPYVLMALLVDSLHSTRPSAFGGRVSCEQTASSGDGPVSSSDAPYACPACDWLRVDTRQVQSTQLFAEVDAVCAVLLPPLIDWPESSIPRSTAYRGPPSRL